MADLQGSQRVYVVRIWREPTADGPGAWRASATDVASRERCYFATPKALATFLSGEGGEDERKEHPQRGDG
jgi:hypothetical protein